MKGKFLSALAAVSLVAFIVASGCNITFTPPPPPPTASMSGIAKVGQKSPATGNWTEQPSITTVADITIKILREGEQVASAVAKAGDGTYKIDEIELTEGSEFKVNAEFKSENYVGTKSFTLDEGENEVDFDLDFTAKEMYVTKK
jgi:hypothetical protein